METLTYAEYGNKSSVAYSDGKYWNLSPKSASGLSPSALTSTLRRNDVLKMASAASPTSFLPPAAFSAEDVIAYNYSKNAGGGASIVINLSQDAIKNAMYIPDTKAMCTQPYVYNSIIKITMTFQEFISNWQNPRLEMTLNAEGYPTSIKQSVSLGPGSRGAISVTSAIQSLEKMSSDLTGTYSISWSLSNWNKTGTPARPF